MFNRYIKFVGVRIALVLALLAGIIAVMPVRAGAETARATNTKANDLNRSDCLPNSGWMWTNGPLDQGVASQVQQELDRKGLRVAVNARSYGETDSCGTYSHHGFDFTITLTDTKPNSQSAQQVFTDTVLPVLIELGKPNLGNVHLISAQGEEIPVSTYTQQPAVQTLSAQSPASDAITKQVYVIVYDPLLSNGQKLSEYMHWNDYATITQQTIDFFKLNSNNRVNYTVANTTIVTSGWPELIDGFSYTETQYMAVWNNPSLHHEPTEVNYNKIVNDPGFDICGKLNRGEIDEVWVYNGPWFGFYESRLVGPGAYPYNSSPISGPHNCDKLLPIMGPSVERTVNEAVHNFGHRTEDTMKKVYGSWQENDTSHSWNKFGLVKAQSPNYSYSGCGSTHYPPNGTTDYDYTNSLNVIPSNCADFINYPTLGDPLVVSQPVDCSAWGCMEINYYGYWFGHMPSNTGCGPDNVANDWWKYITNPGVALYPSYACQVDMRLISGNAGTGNVTLSYTDGTPKTITTDNYGNYFLMVSNHWSGVVTPSKAGYTFNPSNKDYTDVQSDPYVQNYLSLAIGNPGFYVNIATGNNSNSCATASDPCRNIQEAINKANAGDVIYVASGTYLFSTNGSPNVVIIDKDITLSGGWSSDFISQNGASTIDGANTNNGILAISGTVLVENFIVQNSTSSNSGAIYIVNGNFTLSKSTLRNNTATSDGAGIFIDNGTLTVINSTISSNHANGAGGGVYAASNSGASVSIRNSTIAYNSASIGGGISRTNGTYQVTNTIIGNNTSSVSSPDCSGTLASASFNIIENGSGCSVTSGNNNLNVDPQINGNLTGSMPVHMLLAGSPAINAGTTSGCPATDQQGTTRPQGGICDIGSVEYLGTPDTTPPAVVSITRANANPTGAVSVGFTVTFSEAVTGVDVSDFSLTTTGISGSAISNVNGSSNVYTVAVNTGSGNGTIRLDVVDNDSIKDASLNPLGGAGTGNGNFTTGEIYTIDHNITLPEMDLLGNNISIVDGDITPSLTDYTDFGSTLTIGGSVSRTFSIKNTGNGDLNLTGSPKVTISGANTSDFLVTVQPTSPVSSSGSTTFTIAFDPSASGIRSASISIANDDSNENPYNFSIQGQGTGVAAYYVNIATGNNSNACTTVAAPCRNIQEAINKASAGDKIYVASGTYLFSTNSAPNVAIIDKDITLSGGWNSDFTSQNGASTIDGANVNNGILAISGNTVVENFIVQNSISSNSGAIYIVGGNFTLKRSTLRNNTATSNGAGIFLDSGILSVINSTISGNSANGSGGGIYASNNGGSSVTLQNSTIAYNHASTGGGISQTNGTYTLTNTIVANNSGSGPDCNGTVAVANFNVIQNATGCSIISGSNNLNLDPKLDTNLTGAMLVHMLLAGSPAINAGTASGCPSIDQVGTARPQGSGCDIGSIEYTGPFGDTVPPTVQSITRANANPATGASADFTVTFSESVTGVNTGDFSLTTSGVSGAGVSVISGSGNVYTVSVNTGSNSGTIRLDVVDDDSIKDTALNPLGAVGPANGNFITGEVYTVTKPTTINLQSVAANDGWVLESSETSNTGGTLDVRTNTFNLGDDKANKQYLGILHFDTSSLPDTAVITSVTIKIQKQSISGTDPFTTHGGLLADIQKPHFGTTAGLVIGDFQAVAGQSGVATFDPQPASNWYSAIVNSSGFAYVNLTGTTQFRLHFTLDDNNDRGADYIKFYSGDANAANRPQLIIQYYIP